MSKYLAMSKPAFVLQAELKKKKKREQDKSIYLKGKAEGIIEGRKAGKDEASAFFSKENRELKQKLFELEKREKRAKKETILKNKDVLKHIEKINKTVNENIAKTYTLGILFFQYTKIYDCEVNENVLKEFIEIAGLTSNNEQAILENILSVTVYIDELMTKGELIDFSAEAYEIVTSKYIK